MMTRQNYLDAAEDTLDLLLTYGNNEVVPEAAGYDHLADMIDRMKENDNFSTDKLGRWLGWIQGCVYTQLEGRISLDVFKDINMRNSDNV